MKVLIEVKDDKANFILELLNSFSFVKTKTISPAKAQLKEETKKVIHNKKA